MEEEHILLVERKVRWSYQDHVITRGFVYVRDSEGLLTEIRDLASDSIERCISKNIYQWSKLKNEVRNEVGEFVYQKTKRKPIIVPIIMEV